MTVFGAKQLFIEKRRRLGYNIKKVFHGVSRTDRCGDYRESLLKNIGKA